MLKYDPAVFAVGDTYEIMVMVTKPSLMWVRIGEKTYFDETCGILRSNREVHRMTVPADELNAAGGYTLCERELIRRQAYRTTSEAVREYPFIFHPVRDGEIRFFHIADTHSLSREPVSAARAFGRMDFLILNGDLLDHCENAEDFGIVYEIAGEITHGGIPVVFSRGNHDMRGANTEIFPDYTPGRAGKTYYTFRLGPVWGMVLDCGEDKADDHAEYGHTVCCHPFRMQQTEFIREVIENAEKEYRAESVRVRLIISHIPFTHNMGGEFEIERAIYDQWAELIGEHIQPHLMVQGHLHRLSVNLPGSAFDSYGIQPCPVVIASQLEGKAFAGAGFILCPGKIRVEGVTDGGVRVLEQELDADV